MGKTLTKKEADRILDSWRGLNDYLRHATVEQAKRLLDIERKNKQRRPVMIRVYSRYNRMRAEAERVELGIEYAADEEPDCD